MILPFHASVFGRDDMRDLVGDGVCAESTRLARGRPEQPSQPSSPVAARTLGKPSPQGQVGRRRTRRVQVQWAG